MPRAAARGPAAAPAAGTVTLHVTLGRPLLLLRGSVYCIYCTPTVVPYCACILCVYCVYCSVYCVYCSVYCYTAVYTALYTVSYIVCILQCILLYCTPSDRHARTGTHAHMADTHARTQRARILTGKKADHAATQAAQFRSPSVRAIISL